MKSDKQPMNRRRKKVAVVASFPPQDPDSDVKVSGLSSFIQNVLKNSSLHDYTIFSDEISNPTQSQCGDLVIRPVWSTKRPLSYFKVLKIFFQEDYDVVLLNHDFGAFGGTLSAAFMPFFLIFLSILSQRLITIQHSGLTDLQELSRHLQLKPNSVKLRLYSLGVKITLIILHLVSEKVIVLEPAFKERFSKLPLINESSIEVIPHPVYSVTKEDDSLKEPFIKKYSNYVLFFGFLTWYKGADWLIKTASDHVWPDDLSLVMAGGKTINIDNEKYYSEIEAQLKKNPQIIHTGFVPEDAVINLFVNSSAVVLPYRVLFAASGPLAWAITLEKPFLLSENLRSYTHAPDFQEALKVNDLRANEIIFNMDEPASLISKLIRIKTEEKFRNKLVWLSKTLRSSRSIKNIAYQYESVLANITNEKDTK